jgi:hypothetical protein
VVRVECEVRSSTRANNPEDSRSGPVPEARLCCGRPLNAAPLHEGMSQCEEEAADPRARPMDLRHCSRPTSFVCLEEQVALMHLTKLILQGRVHGSSFRCAGWVGEGSVRYGVVRAK